MKGNSKLQIDFRPKLLAALRTYSKEKFAGDLMAGIIVGIVALPLAIAFGIASGVSPEKGLITAIIGGFIVSLLGGSSVQIGGPTGAFIVIVYGIIQNFGIEGLTIATLLAGVFLLLMGLMRLGTVIRFIPYPIIVGFTSGIALTIFTTQIKDLLGLTVEHMPGDFLTKWVVYAESITTISWPAAAVGVASIVLIVLTPRVSKRVPGSLAAIVVMTIVAYILREHFGLTGLETIGDRFEINASLPTPTRIAIKFDECMKLVPGGKPTIRIIRMRKVPFMDSTGLHNLESLCRLSHREGITVVLSGVNDNVRAMLVRSGMDARLGADNICSNIQEALARARALLE